MKQKQTITRLICRSCVAQIVTLTHQKKKIRQHIKLIMWFSIVLFLQHAHEISTIEWYYYYIITLRSLNIYQNLQTTEKDGR